MTAMIKTIINIVVNAVMTLVVEPNTLKATNTI